MAKHKTPVFRSDDACADLRNAVILQAVSDYRRVLRRLRRKPRNKKALLEKAELEEFFLSDWYRVMTEIDGKWLMEKLQKEGSEKPKDECESFFAAGLPAGSTDKVSYERT